MSSSKNTTPADVAAKAEEKKDATVPAQALPEENVIHLDEDQSEKLTLKQRMISAIEKVNAKKVATMSAVAGVIVITVITAVKYINHNSSEEVVENSNAEGADQAEEV